MSSDQPIELIDWDDEDAEVCGETYDHDEVIVHEEPGYTLYECRRCGAEYWSEGDEEETP